ncbi:MAG: hypothetical protein AAF206_22290, partial [Bacteroidota bacterium]
KNRPMEYTLITQIGFIALSILCLGLVYVGLGKAAEKEGEVFRQKIQTRFLMGSLAWLAILSLLSLSGFLYNFELPPPFLIVLIVPLVTLVLILRSAAFQRVLAHIPASWLVYLQAFRIVVEGLLWLLFLDNVIPVQMSFEGRNLDVLVGLTAPFAAFLFFRSGNIQKRAGIIWNIFGLILLANIVITALLSTPTPLRVFMNEPANTIVVLFPYVFLPGILVPLAYYLHILSLRQLLKSA